jgi:hypothetical protein
MYTDESRSGREMVNMVDTLNAKNEMVMLEALLNDIEQAVEDDGSPDEEFIKQLQTIRNQCKQASSRPGSPEQHPSKDANR